jgi:hypothetical protein
VAYEYHSTGKYTNKSTKGQHLKTLEVRGSGLNRLTTPSICACREIRTFKMQIIQNMQTGFYTRKSDHMLNLKIEKLFWWVELRNGDARAAYLESMISENKSGCGK